MAGKAIKETIQGIVVAAGWREDGTVTAVDIAGYDERRYRVANDLMGQKVRLFVQKKVIVDGIVTTKNHRNTIKIHRFQIVTFNPVQPKSDQA